MSIYLDHAATSPLRPEALQAYVEASRLGGNASSVHSLGRKAKILLEESRASILAAVGAAGEGLVFTSGGTESNALAFRQAANYERILVSAIEHDSVNVTAQFAGVPFEVIPVDARGQVNIDVLSERLAAGPAFVAIMLANNETGIITDMSRVCEAVRGAGGWLHIDGVHALGKMPVDFTALGADSLSLSAHKIGGPQGVGALICKRGQALVPLVRGGGQELGLRAGTENIPGIAAFAAALAAVRPYGDDLLRAQAEAEAALLALGATIIGSDAPRVPGVACVAQPSWPSSQQLIHLDMAGICVSSGSACSSGKVKPSRVVAAMGRPDLADRIIRISGGWNSQPEDWRTFVRHWSTGYEMFMKRRQGVTHHNAHKREVV